MSAFIDGESDARMTADVRGHLDDCHMCRRYEESLRSTKRAVRLQPALPVPDLRASVMQRVAAEAPLVLRRRERHRLGRVVAVAAATTVLFLAGAATLWRTRPPEIASATEITTSVQAAARSLSTYRASYAITERGWHPSVRSREFVAEVWFDAPERFRLRVRDLTAYPSASWPSNDVDIVATARRWTIAEPTTCPVESLPSCGSTGMERRALTQRQPFDGTTALPTDIVLPVQTLATSDRFEVLGDSTVSGRTVYQLALTYAEARPMIDALQAGGSWRAFSPDARVLLSIDRETWFPLGFSVTEPGSDRPGLSVRATSFAEPRLPADAFRSRPQGIVKSGDFRPVPDLALSREPAYVAGLEGYRRGRTSNGSLVVTYAKGMTWLKLTYSPAGTTSTARPETSEPVRTRRGIAYYRPADVSLRRTLDVYGTTGHLRIETNLDRAELLRVAASTGFEGHRAAYPEGIEGATFAEIGSLDFTKLPGYLPAGYEFAAAYTTAARGKVSGAVVFFRRPEVEYDGVGIRLTQVSGIRNLAPSSETFGSVSLGDIVARWSPERGELEWVDAGVYRAVAAPALGPLEAERVARSLR